MGHNEAMTSADPIRLGQFLKFTGLADTGADAREMILDGWVRVDGEVEVRRGRQLSPGSVVEVRFPGGERRTEVVA